jgi:hypothetical protein
LLALNLGWSASGRSTTPAGAAAESFAAVTHVARPGGADPAGPAPLPRGVRSTAAVTAIALSVGVEAGAAVAALAAGPCASLTPVATCCVTKPCDLGCMGIGMAMEISDKSSGFWNLSLAWGLP